MIFYYYILSGFDRSAEIEGALEQNIIEKFLTKPFNADEINNIVKGAADSWKGQVVVMPGLGYYS